jgi:hypothetical protein
MQLSGRVLLQGQKRKRKNNTVEYTLSSSTLKHLNTRDESTGS